MKATFCTPVATSLLQLNILIVTLYTKHINIRKLEATLCTLGVTSVKEKHCLLLNILVQENGSHILYTISGFYIFLTYQQKKIGSHILHTISGYYIQSQPSSRCNIRRSLFHRITMCCNNFDCGELFVFTLGIYPKTFLPTNS